MRKPVKDLEDLYEVDENGNVYALPRIKRTPTTIYLSKEKKLKPYNNGYGYMLVDMRKNGKRYMRLVHRLVADAFIPNPNNLPQINHKDGNKSNNCIDNLEWCTYKQNIIHSWKNGLSHISEEHKQIISKATKERWKKYRKLKMERKKDERYKI